jgi:WhiB family redox-sensing transcriptional regulator
MEENDVKCKGVTKFFYPTQMSTQLSLQVTQAKAVCNGLDGTTPCVHRKECLNYAINNHEPYGVWGGTSERDRRKIQRARNKFNNRHIYSMEDVRFPNKVTVKPQPVIIVPRRFLELESNAS